MIIENAPVVVLTGAGVSTPSGIPDFRGDEGLWQQEDPMDVAHISVFENEPERFWAFYSKRLDLIGEHLSPNQAHRSLAKLEELGLIAGVITQNIDGLHQQAGSQVVHEVHGSARTLSCPRCRKVIPRLNASFAEDGVPYCQRCPVTALKPDVILFGELLPAEIHGQAYDLVNACKMLICSGSSLVVQPVASLPQLALDNGAKLAIVNKGDTPYDSSADLCLNGDSAVEWEQVLQNVTVR